MKNRKLKIGELKVQSFVISLDDTTLKTYWGGRIAPEHIYPSFPYDCSALDACPTAWKCDDGIPDDK